MPPHRKEGIAGLLIGLDVRRPLALAVFGVLAASCVSGAPARSSATSPSPARAVSASPAPSPSPSLDPVANQSCPGANAQISTDKSIEALTASQTTASAEVSLQIFLDQYHLTAHVLPFTDSDPSTTFDGLNDGDLPGLVSFGKLFICEYAKYSERWVNRARMKGIAFVKNLKSNPASKPCGYAGIASYATHTVYHSVECITGIPGLTGVQFQRHEVHHEFWHLMAYSLGRYDDPEWVYFNDPVFSYGKEGWDPVTQTWTEGLSPFHPRPGFVTAYAMASVQEDQAETYAALFGPEEYRNLVTWAATDTILKSKFDYLKVAIIHIDPDMKAFLERAG
jgi:hypothetical protein